MTGGNRRSSVRGIMFFCAALLFAAFFFGECDLRRQTVPVLHSAVNAAVFVTMIALIPIITAAMPGKGRMSAFISRSEARNLLILAAATVIPRMIWGLTVQTRIESDYGLYLRMGMYYAENGRPEVNRYLLTVAPNAVTYSVLTGLLIRLFGNPAGTLVAFTEILHLGNVLMVYGIGRKLTSVPRAFFAAAVFALLPENIFYSNIPGIEAPAMFTALAGLLLVLIGRERKTAVRTVICLCGGAVLMLSACIRPNAYAVLSAAVILLIRGKEPAKRKCLRLVAMLAGAAVVFAGYQALRADLFAGEEPVSGVGWSLYEGLDLENGGMWTEEKSARCIEVINAYPPKEADAIFRKEGLERFGSYTFPEKLLMLLRKGGALWYDSRYALFALENSAAADPWIRLANFSWALCLAAMAGGLLYRARHPLNRKTGAAAGLTLTIILLTTAWHLIGTSVGRYHYMLIPFVLLLTAALLPGAKDPMMKEADAER